MSVSAGDGKGGGGSLFGWDARPAGDCPAAPGGAKPEACAYLGLFNADDQQRTVGAKLADVFPERFGPNAKARGRRRRGREEEGGGRRGSSRASHHDATIDPQPPPRAPQVSSQGSSSSAVVCARDLWARKPFESAPQQCASSAAARML